MLLVYTHFIPAIKYNGFSQLILTKWSHMAT